MEHFAKLVKRFSLLTVFAECSILDVWQGSESARKIVYSSKYSNWSTYVNLLQKIKYLSSLKRIKTTNIKQERYVSTAAYSNGFDKNLSLLKINC